MGHCDRAADCPAMTVATLFAAGHAGVLKDFVQHPVSVTRPQVSYLVSVRKDFPREPDVESFPGLRFQSSHAILLIRMRDPQATRFRAMPAGTVWRCPL